jgi:hypothetical protein
LEAAPKIVNVGITDEPNANNNKRFREVASIKKMTCLLSDKNKSDELERKNSMKDKTMMCEELNDSVPMKRFIKIEKIALPKATPYVRVSFTKHLRYKLNKKAIEGSSLVGFKPSKMTLSRHPSREHPERNYNSSPSKMSRICEESLESLEVRQLRLKTSDDLQIRRPLTRKEYFVFGLTDRTNFESKTC